MYSVCTLTSHMYYDNDCICCICTCCICIHVVYVHVIVHVVYVHVHVHVDAIHMPGLARRHTDRIRASKRKAE